MKKVLLPIGMFIGTFFGLFAIINLLIVVIFPVSWNDVVTCPGWIVCYFFIGLMVSIAVTDAYVSDNL